MDRPKCPKGSKKINGLCVPYKTMNRRTTEYGSLFSNDIDGSEVFAPPDNPYEDMENFVPDIPDVDFVDNTFTDGDRAGRYTITPDGIVVMEYDDGSVDRYPPDMYAQLLSNTDIEFAERIQRALMPFITDDIAQEISDAMNQEVEQNEIADTGQDSMRFEGMPSGNTFYYLDENGNQQSGTWSILGGSGSSAGTVYLTIDGQTTSYTPSQYQQLMTQDRLFPSDLLEQMADYATPSRDEPATRDPVNPNNNNPVEDYEQITNFHYMSNGQVVTGGSANVYDDRVEIFDTFGNLMYDEPIYYDQENHPNRYSVSYDGQTVVYNQNGQINRNATESYQ